MFFRLACVLIAMFLVSTSALAQTEFTQADRDRLIQLLAKVEQMDKRIDDLRTDTNMRFQELRADMNARFEQVNKQFEQVNNQFNTITNLLVAIVGAFAAIVVMTIGFALWDRRTMLRPVEEKLNKLERDMADDVLEQVKGVRERLEKMEQLTRKRAEAETEKQHHVQKVLGEMQSRGGDDARLATTFRSLL
jgi:predicted PurR-regulated permease PerM